MFPGNDVWDEGDATGPLAVWAGDAAGVAAATVACRTGGKVVEARVSVGPAKTAIAWVDLPAVLMGLVVARPEDFSADRAGSALEQSPEAPEGTDQQSVCGVSVLLHVPVGRSCLAWVHGATTLIRTLEQVGWYQ